VEEKIRRNSGPSVGENNQQTAFFKRLNGSRPAVFAVAEYLHSLDFTVSIPRIRYAPSMKQIADYQDNGDITIETEEGEEYRIEVKGMRFNFTGEKDWPYQNCIVSNKAAVDRAYEFESHIPPPKAYFIVSADLQYAACIPDATKPTWTVEDIKTNNTNKIETFYVCPKKELRWRKLKGN
jgi:hypothetical protein